MDQFLRSAIDLSDIEAKVLSGGYESDSGYSTYDVSPITSSAPAQLGYPSSTQMASMQTHRHHIEQAMFNCNLSPTATMFPGAPVMNQPSTSLPHDTMHSPCNSDVGFFSPHSGFSSHTTTPSHQDTLSFFPAHAPCPIFSSYSQAQDFNSLNMSTCFPDGSVPSTDSAIPSFSSQIPDILLPDASLAPGPMSMPSVPAKFPKPEPVHTACKVQVPQMTKPVESSPTQHAQSAAEVKIEPLPNSCVFGSQSEPSSGTYMKTERGETQATSCEQGSTSSQAILSKLLGQNGAHPTIVSITAINNNGTTTKLNLSQLQALVGQSTNAADKGSANLTAAKVVPQSGSASDSEVSPSKGTSPKSVPMKASQRKKGQWPRSMSKANLMAFREHILNKLKKGQESSSGAGGDSSKEKSGELSSMEVMKCETPSPSSGCEVKVTYERNHTADSRCHSEPADMFGGPNGSPCLQLQASHSEGHLHSSTSVQQTFGLSDVDTKLADFFPQNCNDVLNLFQFNPDAFLSTSIDDQLLDGLDLGFDDEDSNKVDREIARFLDSEINGTTPEVPMDVGVQYDVVKENSPITTPPLSHHASPLVSPANYNSSPSSPQRHQTCSYNSVSPTSSASSTPYLSERALVTGHVTTGPMSMCGMSMFNFPDMLTNGNEIGGVSCESEMKLHIQQNLLQSHHDPLLAGSTMLQACGREAFEI